MEDKTQIVLPKLGESIVSATVVRWFKNIGERVRKDEPLLEVSTDKVNSEIPSPVEGVVHEILAMPDCELQVGEVLATISSEKKESEGSFLSPAVLRLLQEKKLALHEVEKIPHTGENGRLTKKDVENYCQPMKAWPQSIETERVKMSAMRKAIADNMVKSFYEAPHASLVTEVDVTHLVKWVADHKLSFQKEHGIKISISSFVAKAIANALNLYPLLNSSLENDTIVMKRFVHLGIAVSVDQGVQVPVIRSVQEKSLVDIAKEIASLAEKARGGRLEPKEVQEGSITMTNFGMTGTLIGIPIIRYPEVAIVGVGAIVKKVCAMKDDSIAIRSMMMISLTFDHRVLDGLYGCGFLNELKKQLEDQNPFCPFK